MRTPKDIKQLAKSVRHVPDTSVDQRVLAAMDAAFERRGAIKPVPLWKAVATHRITRLAVAALVFLVIILALPDRTGQQTPSDEAYAQTLYEQGDCDALVELLKTGTLQLKLLVASYLADIGTLETRDSLQALMQSELNPTLNAAFARAVDAINRRLVPESPEPNEPNEVPPYDANEPNQAPAAAAVDLVAAEWEFDLLVMDRNTQRPVPSARVEAIAAPLELKGQAYETDSQGHLLLQSGTRPRTALRLLVRKEGYVTTELSLNRSISGSDRRAQYTLGLEPGTTIGGIIHSEAGKPLAGIEVRLVARMQVHDGVVIPILDATCRSNAEGRWVCHEVPAKLHRVQLSVDDPGLVAKSDEEVFVSLLRRQNFVTVVTNGILLSGLVTDTEGHLIEGARIDIDPETPMTPVAVTDAHGFYEVRLKAGRYEVTVVADGHTPTMRAVFLNDSAKPCDFRLAPGSNAIFRVLDSDQQPIAGACIEVIFWRNRPFKESQSNVIDHKVITNEQGVAILKNCPVEPIGCEISREGYVTLDRITIEGGDASFEFTLKRQGRYTGRVLDAHTDMPIPYFTMLQGVSYLNGQHILWEEQATPFHNRPYEFVFSADQMVLRILADGYAPLDSPIWTNDETSHVHDVYLTPEEQTHIDWRLTIVDPQGDPAPDADVAFLGLYAILRFNSRSFNCAQSLRGYIPTYRSDATGLVILPKNPNHRYVGITHASGYASLDLEDLNSDRIDITLTPWGRIEGQVLEAGPSGSDIVIQAWEQMPPNGLVRYEEETLVQADGTFVFERVVPGAISIAHMARTRSGATQKVMHQTVDVVAGKTSYAHIDLDLLTVKAQVTINGDNVDYEPLTAVLESYVDTNSLDVEIPVPVNYLCMTRSEYDQWRKDAQSDAERQAYRKAVGAIRSVTHRYKPSHSAEGILEFENIRPGIYTLLAELGDYGRSDLYFVQTEPVVVPKSGNPVFNWGVVDLPYVPVARAGSPAPDFHHEILGGGQVKRDDYRDKFLLIDTSCRRYVTFQWGSDYVPPLKELYAYYEHRDDVELLSICKDTYYVKGDMRPCFTYAVEQHDIRWPLAMTPDVTQSIKELAVCTFPDSFTLVSPEGMVLGIINRRNIESLVETVKQMISDYDGSLSP
jgi:hypothetical protein